MTIADLMGNNKSAEIRCAIKGSLVRVLVVEGDAVVVDALTEEVTVPFDTELTYEPWFMDRGSILFAGMKLCTEGDRVIFEDGTRKWMGQGTLI